MPAVHGFGDLPEKSRDRLREVRRFACPKTGRFMPLELTHAPNSGDRQVGARDNPSSSPRRL